MDCPAVLWSHQKLMKHFSIIHKALDPSALNKSNYDILIKYVRGVYLRPKSGSNAEHVPTIKLLHLDVNLFNALWTYGFSPEKQHLKFSVNVCHTSKYCRKLNVTHLVSREAHWLQTCSVYWCCKISEPVEIVQKLFTYSLVHERTGFGFSLFMSFITRCSQILMWAKQCSYKHPQTADSNTCQKDIIRKQNLFSDKMAFILGESNGL